MNRILVAYARNASREKICQLVAQVGYTPLGSYRSGAEVIEAVRTTNANIIICGCQLSDMTADELAEKLSGKAAILVAASPSNIEQLRHPALIRLPAPFTPEDLTNALRTVSPAKPTAPVKPAAPTQRSPEEIALINRAKAHLIAQGMTEPEAHSTLQRRSMRDRCKLTETARRILAEAGQSTDV